VWASWKRKVKREVLGRGRGRMRLCKSFKIPNRDGWMGWEG
jgi:hypothetical protein